MRDKNPFIFYQIVLIICIKNITMSSGTIKPRGGYKFIHKFRLRAIFAWFYGYYDDCNFLFLSTVKEKCAFLLYDQIHICAPHKTNNLIRKGYFPFAVNLDLRVSRHRQIHPHR